MYSNHFKLNSMPFRLTPDMEFDTDLSKQQEALRVLQIGLHQGEGLMKITGEVGTGKTFLCRKLIKNLPDNYCSILILDPHLNRLNLLQEISDELEIPQDGFNDGRMLIKRIREKLFELHSENKKVVIIVDEAQLMPPKTLEALRLLTNIETSKEKLVQVILFGQPELDDVLAINTLRQLRQRIVFSYHLKPMNTQELEYYVEHRLKVCGSPMIFQKRSLPLLFKASKGVPRLVNILAHKSLMSAFGSGGKEIQKLHIRKAICDTDTVKNIKPLLLSADFLLLMIGSSGIFMLTFWLATRF